MAETVNVTVPGTSATEFTTKVTSSSHSVSGSVFGSGEPAPLPADRWICDMRYSDGSGGPFWSDGSLSPLDVACTQYFWSGSGTVTARRDGDSFRYKVRRSDKLTPMVGRTMTGVEGAVGDCELKFVSGDGSAFIFFNDEDASNDVSVLIEDIVGDLSDLVGSPIVEAEEVSSEGAGLDPSCTWTFYRFSTVKGTVTIRWCGQGNGYYSEEVMMRIVEPAAKEQP